MKGLLCALYTLTSSPSLVKYKDFTCGEKLLPVNVIKGIWQNKLLQHMYIL